MREGGGSVGPPYCVVFCPIVWQVKGEDFYVRRKVAEHANDWKGEKFRIDENIKEKEGT